MTVSALHPSFYDRRDRLDADEKYGRLFAEMLEHGLVAGASVADAALSDAFGTVLDVVVVVPDVADWTLRYSVQDVARAFEDQYAKSVVCRFRASESATV